MQEDNKTTYFQYGPYRSAEDEQGNQEPAEVTSNNEKRGTSFRTIFASFMAGVIVVASLMYVADTNNLFTADAQQGAVETTSSRSTTVLSTLDTTRPSNVAAIFEAASPAVVKIETFAQPSRTRSGFGLFDDPFFRNFFGDDESGKDSDSTGNLEATGIGTGFIFDSSGYILTNQHVIANADKIEVTIEGYDKPLTAKKLGSNYDLDLAVLKVEASNLQTLKIGDSNSVNVGDWVVAIGNPYGFDHTVTVGVVSSKERPISISDSEGTRNYEHLLQTDASINPGNSGGPLLNLKGEVIGINTAISAQAQGIGFAIPTTTILDHLESLKANKAISKTPVPFIGASLQDISNSLKDELGLTSTEGTVIVNVLYQSPAYTAGLRQYDVITALNGKPITTSKQLIDAIKERKVGDQVKLTVVRNAKSSTVSVTIGDRNQFTELQ